MYRIRHSIFISFAHHVRGHLGPCIGVHGHTWKFEVELGSEELTPEGFVVDFGELRTKVLRPCHALLDHSMALGERGWREAASALATLGGTLVATRQELQGCLGEPPPTHAGTLGGARNELPGGIKVAIFPFSPTSERLSKWLYDVAKEALEDGRVKVLGARVFESLHPTESLAEYVP